MIESRKENIGAKLFWFVTHSEVCRDYFVVFVLCNETCSSRDSSGRKRHVMCCFDSMYVLKISLIKCN